MDDQGTTVNLEGTALSTDAVANLIANLQKTGFFRTVEIKETYQDEQVKEMQAFQFTLTCDRLQGKTRREGKVVEATYGELWRIVGHQAVGLVILGGVAVTAALYFTVFKSQNDKNVAAQHALEEKIREKQ